MKKTKTFLFYGEERDFLQQTEITEHLHQNNKVLLTH